MMTKLKLTALLLLFSFCAWGQIINFDSIKVNVQDENSAMYYEKLIYKFKFDPTLLSGEEVNHLYYGKKFSKYTAGLFDKDFGECSEYISRGNMKKAIIHGEKYLEKDPTNTEMLAYMEMAYRTLQKDGAIDGFSKGKDSIFFKVYRTMEDFGF